MDILEKVEKLREGANVSYEDAKEALEASGGDLLDAMIYLERRGRVKDTEAAEFTTAYEESKELAVVKSPDSGNGRKDRRNRNNNSEGIGAKMGKLIKNIWKKLSENFFVIERKGAKIVDIPVWILILILIFAWRMSLVLLIVGLFFDCRYFFEGKVDLSKVNDVMDKASDIAESVKDKVEEMTNQDDEEE